MTTNLTGFTEHNNYINLKGPIDTTVVKPSIKLINLKKYILANYVIPLYSEQWDIINKNKFLINETIDKLNLYYKLYKLDEIIVFLELLKIIKILIDKQDLLTDLEYKNNKTYEKNNIINMVYKISKIKILPEYEIYNMIIGKPNKNEYYDNNIISDIKMLIKSEFITYDKMNTYILNKYNIRIK